MMSLFDYEMDSRTELSDKEPEKDSWWSGAGDFFTDIGKSAVGDLSIASKSLLQNEINKKLEGAKEESSKYDVGRLQYETDQSNRAGLLPSFFLTGGKEPGRPDTIGGGLDMGSMTKMLIIGGGLIAGLLVLKRFL